MQFACSNRTSAG